MFFFFSSIVVFLFQLILFSSNSCGAHMHKAQADFANIEVALKMYYLDNNQYPSTEQGLAALVIMPESQSVAKTYREGGYLPEIPITTGGSEYHYRYQLDGENPVITLEESDGEEMRVFTPFTGKPGEIDRRKPRRSLKQAAARRY